MPAFALCTAQRRSVSGVVALGFYAGSKLFTLVNSECLFLGSDS